MNKLFLIISMFLFSCATPKIVSERKPDGYFVDDPTAIPSTNIFNPSPISFWWIIWIACIITLVIYAYKFIKAIKAIKK